jgi:hypothetical protein
VGRENIFRNTFVVIEALHGREITALRQLAVCSFV